jgi:hypothetical protein
MKLYFPSLPANNITDLLRLATSNPHIRFRTGYHSADALLRRLAPSPPEEEEVINTARNIDDLLAYPSNPVWEDFVKNVCIEVTHDKSLEALEFVLDAGNLGEMASAQDDDVVERWWRQMDMPVLDRFHVDFRLSVEVSGRLYTFVWYAVSRGGSVYHPLR